VWLTDNSAIAEALAARMRVAIDDDGSAFSNVRQTLVTGRPVYRVDGPGEDHFFYHSERYGRQAVWLTVSVSNPLDVLEETVKYY
jgi:hypothetical protein